MAISINTNVSSLIAQGSLNKNLSSLQKTMQMLSTGLRINTAGDDAAGLTISENMKVQIKGSSKAMDNVQDAKNFTAVAEGGLNSIGEHLQRINELLVQGASDFNDVNSRKAILTEVSERLKSIDVLAQSTSFNGRTMLDGSIDPADPAKKMVIQIGAYADADPTNPLNTLDISRAFTNCRLTQLGTVHGPGAGLTLPAALDPQNAAFNPTGDAFRAYMNEVQASIKTVTESQGLLGAYVNRMESTYDNLSATVENLETAKSRITDTDIAKTSSDMVKAQILQQTSSSILIQANQMPGIALSLIGG